MNIGVPQSRFAKRLSLNWSVLGSAAICRTRFSRECRARGKVLPILEKPEAFLALVFVGRKPLLKLGETKRIDGRAIGVDFDVPHVSLAPQSGAAGQDLPARFGSFGFGLWQARSNLHGQTLTFGSWNIDQWSPATSRTSTTPSTTRDHPQVGTRKIGPLGGAQRSHRSGEHVGL